MSVSSLERVFDSWENENGPEPGVGSTGRGLTLNRTQLDWRAAMQSTQPCNVPGCDRSAVLLARTICRLHYQRKWRGGDLDGPVRTVRKSRGTCRVEDCGVVDDGLHGYCKKHIARIKRHGSPDVVIHQRDRAIPRGEDHPKWKGDAASYNAVHLRLKKGRGPASAHECVDCGGRGSQWSYNRLDPEQRDSEFGPYSTDLDFYEARCVPCHKAFDLRALGKKQ